MKFELNKEEELFSDDEELKYDEADFKPIYHTRDISLNENKLIAKEFINIEKLNFIINNKSIIEKLFESQSPDDFTSRQISKIKQKLKNGTIQVEYKQKPHRQMSDCGLQCLKREIRAYLADEYYYDIDFVNSGPTIILSIMDYKQIDRKYLKQYVMNREQIIESILEQNPDKKRDDVKLILNSITLGGSYAGLTPSKWIKGFYNEMRNFREDIPDLFKKEYKATLKELEEKEEDVKNAGGKTLSKLVYDRENKLLMFMLNNFRERNKITDNYVLCFDGILVPKDNFESMVELDRYLRSIEREFETRIGINMKLKCKPMNPLELEEKVNEYLEREAPLHYDMFDNYTFEDFRKALISKTWDNLDELKDFCARNINRVMMIMTCGDKYVKKDGNDPFQIIPRLIGNIIKYYEKRTKKIKGEITITDEIVEISLDNLFNRHLINMVKVYNNLISKPTPIDASVDNTGMDYNVWRGFKSKLLKESEIDYSMIEPILNHIKVVWAYDDDIKFKYICSWFHHLFRTPWLKNKVAMIFQSKEQQVGKSILIDEFMNPYIFGKTATVQQGLKFSTDRFNDYLMGKLLVVCEELDGNNESNFNSTCNAMKKLITNRTTMIEIKGGAKFEIDDYTNYIGFTQWESAVKIEEDDRRYFITRVNPVYRDNFTYFNGLASTFNQETANHFMSYIYWMDDAVDVRIIPETDLKNQMKVASLSSPQRFIYTVKEIRENKTDYEEEETGWRRAVLDNDVMKGLDLYKQYSKYCLEEKEREFSHTNFGKMIKDVIGKHKIGGYIKYDLTTIKMDY